MARIPWLADAARATGHPVIEVSQWQTRGTTLFAPKGLLWHHTAGPVAGDMPSLNILINGRAGLPGPLSQYGLGRSGTIYVVAAGRANHAGDGGWNGLTGNGSVIGIEAEHTGKSTTPWPAVQLDAYRKLSAQILTRLGTTVENMCAHREWAPTRKVDPISLNMADERARVAALMNGDDMASEAQKTLVGLAYNLFPEEMEQTGPPSTWVNMDEHSANWSAHFNPAISTGAQNLFLKLAGHPHGASSGTVDQTARTAAAAAKTSADRANKDLAEIKGVIG